MLSAPLEHLDVGASKASIAIGKLNPL